MAWDFSTEPEFQKKLDWVEEFCKEEVEPLELLFPFAVRAKRSDPKMAELVEPLQQQIKDMGLWAVFLDEELGGPGYGQLKLGLLNEILGKYGSAPAMFGCQAPDTGNMEMLAAYGTEEQKERWLKPLMNQEIFSAYSMTEPQGGSDPNLFKTTAVRDGNEWVINGEKWFTSAGRAADILFVMTVNGMFVVPRDTPGVEIQPYPSSHNWIKYNDVRVPLDHLLGPENGAKVLAQRRLGGGRIHHAMRTIAQCKKAFDMMCERALSRESHGKIIAEHQMVQEKIAESYADLEMLRLFVLQTAWKIDNTSTQETRTDIAAVKFTMARVLREISFRALHIFGSLGTTNLTPLQAMYAGAPTMGIADGVDEVHKATVARNVLKNYRPHEGLFPTEFIPHKKEAALKKFEARFEADPELKKRYEQMQAYMASRG
jgi:acyl-CoA dehydrogenase